MSLKVEDALPPPHLFSGRSATWPSSYLSQACSLGSSPATKSPQLSHAYHRTQESALSCHNLDNMPTTGWYHPSVTAADYQYTDYEHDIRHRSSIVLSPPTPVFSQAAQGASTTAHTDPSTRVISPVPIYPQSSLLSEAAQRSIGLSQSLDPMSQTPGTHRKFGPLGQQSPHGSYSVVASVPSTSWAMDSLGICTPSLRSDSWYPNFAQSIRGPGSEDSHLEGHGSTVATPQLRGGYTPIAPQPTETPRTMRAKRVRDDDETAEVSKRRRRSESTTSTQLELTEEDKLLLKLKEEESMPWKEIAARFQKDMGKQYQIPALQMRLKRLRERMRVWSEADVRALRMAHEYWAQNKFDIVSQKMVEFGAQEKWTARQCARKWAETDGMPTPMAQYDQQAQHTFTPYSMSPAEPATAFLPYMHS